MEKKSNTSYCDALRREDVPPLPLRQRQRGTEAKDRGPLTKASRHTRRPKQNAAAAAARAAASAKDRKPAQRSSTKKTNTARNAAGMQGRPPGHHAGARQTPAGSQVRATAVKPRVQTRFPQWFAEKQEEVVQVEFLSDTPCVTLVRSSALWFDRHRSDGGIRAALEGSDIVPRAQRVTPTRSSALWFDGDRSVRGILAALEGSDIVPRAQRVTPTRSSTHPLDANGPARVLGAASTLLSIARRAPRVTLRRSSALWFDARRSARGIRTALDASDIRPEETRVTPTPRSYRDVLLGVGAPSHH